MLETKGLPSSPPAGAIEPVTVALLAYTYPPENEIGAARPHRFARYLPEYGYRVRVFSAGEFPGAAPDPPAWRTPDRKLSRWELPIRRFLLPGEDGFSWIHPVGAAVEELHRREKVHALISTAPPVAAHLAAGRLSRRLGIPWIADFRDPLAGSPIRTAGLMQHVDPLLEKWIVRRAAAVTVCTNVMQRIISERYPGQEGLFHLLWNGFDPQRLFRPPLRAEASGPRRLVHLGSLYDVRDPNPLLSGLARLIENGRLAPEAAQVRLIGFLDESFERAQPAVWQRLRQAGALHVVPRHQPADVVRQEIEQADSLLLVDMNPGGVGYALPGKVFEYIPAGRPIVAMTTPGAPAVWVLENSGVPTAFLYAGDSPSRVDEALLDWMRMPRGPHEPSAWFWENFDGRRQAGFLAGLLDQVTGRVTGRGAR